MYTYPTNPYLHQNNRNPRPIRKELGYPHFQTPVQGDHGFMPSPDEQSLPYTVYSNANPRSQCSYPRALADQYGYHTPLPHDSVENQHDKSPYPEYLIDVRSVISGQNKRLTVMLRNVPNRYTPADLKRVLDAFIYSDIHLFFSFLEKYQIVTFPNDVRTHRTLGEAFMSWRDNSALLTRYRHVGNVFSCCQRCTMSIGQIVIIKKCVASATRL